MTAANAANRRLKIRGRTVQLLCNPSFPTLFLTTLEARTGSLTSRLSRKLTRFPTRSLWPQAEMSRPNNGVTAIAGAVVGAAAIARKDLHSHPFNLRLILPRFLIPVAQPAKAPRPKPWAKRPST